jgi:rhodanese-related sulfurtransferase
MKSKLAAIFFFFVTSFFAYAGKPNAPKLVEGSILVNAEQALRIVLQSPKIIIIDSRHAEEFAKGHIEGAVNLLDTSTNENNLNKLVPDKTTPLLFYCNGENCLRSANAARNAVNAGYQKVYWFRGGWVEWQRSKMPVAKQ